MANYDKSFNCDAIDAHQTGGLAERIVAALNGGMTEDTAAHLFGVSNFSVQYLCVHEEYGVNPKPVRVLEALQSRRAECGFNEVRKQIAAIRKEVRRARSTGM